MMVVVVVVMMMMYLWLGLSTCILHVPRKSRNGTFSNQHSVPHCRQCCRSNDVNMATIATATNDVVCWSG